MKKLPLIIISLFILSSCTTNDDNTAMTEKFNLVNVSGGFAGINENFVRGEIIWIFNEQNGTLVVEKNVQNTFSGLSEGNYSYSFKNINDKQYIFINNIERGSVTNQTNSMVINENEQSNGSGADRFVYQLEK